MGSGLKTVAILLAFAVVACGSDLTTEPAGLTEDQCSVEWMKGKPQNTENADVSELTVQRAAFTKWNDTPVTRKDVSYFLKVANEIVPKPIIQVNFEKAASCRDRAMVLKMLRSADICATNCKIGDVVDDTELAPPYTH